MASVILAGTTSTTALNLTGDTSGELQLKTNNGSTTAMTLTTAGNVGIGTTSPRSKLDVNGSIYTEWSDTNFIGMQFGSDTSSYRMGMLPISSTRDLQIYSKSGDSFGVSGITFYTGTGPTERMRIDSSGNVGIGRTSPAAVFGGSGGLDAAGYLISRGSINSHQTSAGVFQYSGNETTIRSYGATAGTGAIVFNTGGGGGSADSERMRIDSSGNVGIGTSSPSQKLHLSNSSGNTFLQVSSGSNNIYYGWENSRSVASVQSNTAITFDTGGSYTERMRIDSSGNVGIGLNPSGNYQLEGGTGTSAASRGFNLMAVSGGFSGGDYPSIGYNFRTTASSGSYTYNAADTAARILFSSVGTTFSTAASGTTGNAITWSERMRITSGGDLIVGTTATINSERLNVRQSSSANTTGIAVGYGTTAGQFRSMSIISTNVMTFNNGLNEATLTAAGAWTNASDARLKNSIVDIKYGLETVLATQPRSYKMNDLEGDYIGFVAQEIQTVIPEVVSGDPETQLGVDYGSLVAVAFKAIQEQQAIITDLKQRIETLEAK